MAGLTWRCEIAMIKINMKRLQISFPEKDFFISIFKDEVYMVGGTVRDVLLYKKIAPEQDIDLLVTGLSYDEIAAKLEAFGKTDTVGKSFAVIKFTREGKTFDIAVPRRDKKKDGAGHSHKNFLIQSGPQVTLEEDLGRRDFTCNSIAVRLGDGLVVDPHQGLQAIADKHIVMTSPASFSDDPLRVLRAARFAAVHGFSIDKAIYAKAKKVPLNELSAERIADELFRLLLESPQPAAGLQEYLRLTVLDKLFPELSVLALTIQDAHFHPEKDEQGHHSVWAHTLLTVDIVKKLAGQFRLDAERSLALLLAALLHDCGKAETTTWEFKRGRMTVTSAFHDSQGSKLTENILDRLRIDSRQNFPLKKTVLKLVQQHHRIFELYRNREEITFKAIARAVKDMDGEDLLLLLLDFADRRSREAAPLNFSELDEIALWFGRKKEEYQITRETIQPLIQGRDLIALGIPPGRQMGAHLKKLYDLQLDGAFQTREQGLQMFKETPGNKSLRKKK
jgi:tRNA nucleotidyltransferase/poly(A) polymerase